MKKHEIIELLSKAKPTSFFVGYRDIIYDPPNENKSCRCDHNQIAEGNFGVIEHVDIEHFVKSTLESSLSGWLEWLDKTNYLYEIDEEESWLEKRHSLWDEEYKGAWGYGFNDGKCPARDRFEGDVEDYEDVKEMWYYWSLVDCDCRELLFKKLKKEGDDYDLDCRQLYTGCDIFTFENEEIKNKIESELEEHLSSLVEEIFKDKIEVQSLVKK